MPLRFAQVPRRDELRRARGLEGESCGDARRRAATRGQGWTFSVCTWMCRSIACGTARAVDQHLLWETGLIRQFSSMSAEFRELRRAVASLQYAALVRDRKGSRWSAGVHLEGVF